MSELLSVDTVLNRILTQVSTLPEERVPTAEALGRVLTRGIVAEQNIPPFANSSMDGYAVRAADVGAASRENPVQLAVVEDIQA